MSISIADCELCARLPQKIDLDIEQGGPGLVPPEVGQLATVLTLEDTQEGPYCSNVTRLLKCRTCGSYYYYNRYDDDGEHFMDPTCDEVTVRRYDLASVAILLQQAAGGGDDALPGTLGQLRKAFIEGESLPSTRPQPYTLQEMQTARLELGDLQTRLPQVLEDLRRALLRPGLNWQIQRYAVETLCGDCFDRQDWPGLRRELLGHADPLVRLTAALLVIGIGSGDAPVVDLVHVPLRVRRYLKAELRRRGRWAELARVLLELALTCDAMTLQYEHRYDGATYVPVSVRAAALYGLLISEDHGSRLAAAIPRLAGLLLQDRALNLAVCRLLERLAKKRGQAQLILAALQAHPRQSELAADASIQNLLHLCQAQQIGPI